MMNYIMLTIK